MSVYGKASCGLGVTDHRHYRYRGFQRGSVAFQGDSEEGDLKMSSSVSRGFQGLRFRWVPEKYQLVSGRQLTDNSRWRVSQGVSSGYRCVLGLPGDIMEWYSEGFRNVQGVFGVETPSTLRSPKASSSVLKDFQKHPPHTSRNIPSTFETPLKLHVNTLKFY